MLVLTSPMAGLPHLCVHTCRVLHLAHVHCYIYGAWQVAAQLQRTGETHGSAEKGKTVDTPSIHPYLSTHPRTHAHTCHPPTPPVERTHALRVAGLGCE